MAEKSPMKGAGNGHGAAITRWTLCFINLKIKGVVCVQFLTFPSVSHLFFSFQFFKSLFSDTLNYK